MAVGSGGIWKTRNAGVTWTPIFDDQGSYSLGCVALDPRQPEVVRVGTGEKIGGRHVGVRARQLKTMKERIRRKARQIEDGDVE